MVAALIVLSHAVSVVTASSSASCLDPRDYGAVVDSPSGIFWENNTKAFQTALDDASGGKGGGVVCVRAGDYTCSDLHTRSNSVLELGPGSRVLTAPGNATTALLHIDNAENVTVRGEGVLYGNAEKYIKYYDPVSDRFEPTSPDGRRPRVVKAFNSSNVRLIGIRVQNASDWNVHIQACRDVLIDGLRITGDWRFPNNDGIDPDSSINVLIQNTFIDVADDGVCPKATSGLGPLRNLTVRNVTIRSKSHAIKFGSNTDEEMSDVLFEDVVVRDSNGGLSIQARGAGDIHNVTWRRLRVETRYVAPRWWGNADAIGITAEPRDSGDTIGKTYDLTFEDVEFRSENGAFISGLTNGIQNLVVRNVRMTIDRWSNYSSGQGPSCYANGRVYFPIQCMGTLDRRPSAGDGGHCSYACREPAKADGFRLENVQHAIFDNVTVVFAGERAPWFGECFTYDEKTVNVTYSNTHCINGP